MSLNQLLGLDQIRIAFLISGFITLIIFWLRNGPVIGLRDLWTILLDFLLVPFAILTVLTFAIIITGTDPTKLLLQFSQFVSGHRNVSFIDAIPPPLKDTLEVAVVRRLDTDGDEFEEWLVFYEYDLQPGVGSPVLGAVYDNDRGNPPVIFPYQLHIPGRDPVGTFSRAVNFDLIDVTQDSNGPSNENLPEIRVTDGAHLSFFRFNQNSATWDFPRDAPPRYESIGYFVGNGGVRFRETNKDVTTIDLETYNRSQLALRSVFALNPVSNSYWDDFEHGKLAAPKLATVDFFRNPPENVLNSTYPEKVVLAFYAATCGTQDQSLCLHANAGWDPKTFLVPNEDAWREFENENAGYFGLNTLTGSQNVLVSDIRYYPQLEQDSTESTVTGPQPQANVVDVIFSVNGTESQGVRYLMDFHDGRWKILRRVSPEDGIPSTIDRPPIEVGSTQ